MSQKASGSVAPHKHCPVCGISISPSRDYCSTACEQRDEENLTRMKNYRRLTLILMIGAFAVLVGVTLFLHLHG